MVYPVAACLIRCGGPVPGSISGASGPTEVPDSTIGTQHSSFEPKIIRARSARVAERDCGSFGCKNILQKDEKFLRYGESNPDPADENRVS